MSDTLRRPPRRIELAELDRRNWYLWALNFAITLSLALGIAVIFYPAIRWRAYAIEARLLPLLPQLVAGLVILIFLEAFYIITKQRELNELRKFILATHTEAGLLGAEYSRDSLTGILDRRALPDILRQETAWVNRYRTPLCLVLFDIREFSKINEKEGNLAGDQVLKDLARVLQATIRQSDSVLRYGPDQFLCFLPRTDLKGGEAFTRRIAKACQGSARLRGLAVNSGLAEYQAGADPSAILSNAERDLELRRASAAVQRAAP